MLQRLLAVLLVLALWPALGETVELAVHLAEHGDLAHAPHDAHEGEPLGANEHGCSGVFHLCSGGHVSATSAPHVVTSVVALARVTTPATPPPLSREGQHEPAPELRPPIA